MSSSAGGDRESWEEDGDEDQEEVIFEPKRGLNPNAAAFSFNPSAPAFVPSIGMARGGPVMGGAPVAPAAPAPGRAMHSQPQPQAGGGGGHGQGLGAAASVASQQQQQGQAEKNLLKTSRDVERRVLCYIMLYFAIVLQSPWVAML